MASRADYGPRLTIIDSESKAAEPMGWWTREDYIFDELFLKKLWSRAETLDYFTEPVKGGEKKLHVNIFRQFLDRFHFILTAEGEKPNVNVEQFGAASSSGSGQAYLTWTDLRRVFETGNRDSSIPRIRLTFPEQCNFVFDGRCNSAFDGFNGQGQGESYLSCSVGLIIFLAIIVNVIQIFGLVGESVGTVCAIIFSIEYVCKFAMAPFCRYNIFNEDVLLEKVVPDPKEADGVVSGSMSRADRLAKFFFEPTNLIDFLSILPTWIEPLVQMVAPGGVNLTFLRALRLFRLFRILKFGKFSATLTVLGVTIFHSVGSIGVLCLYITMIAMLAGAVIQQFECGDPECSNLAGEGGDEDLLKAFVSVPMAMKWVAGRMVTMQHSTPEKKALPQNLVSSLVVIFMGLFKGVIFVLPIATVTEAYKEAEEEKKMQERLQKEIEENRLTPLGLEWCKDPTAPAARVEIVEEIAPDSKPKAIGTVNLPFYTEGWDRNRVVKLWVPVIGSLKGRLSRYPGVEVSLSWAPDADSKPKEMLPKGKLTVQVIRGANFVAKEGSRWRVAVEVPVKLHPKEGSRNDHLDRKEYKQVGGGTSTPEFGIEQDFVVCWEEKGTGRPGEEQRQRQVLDLLKQQGQALQALESKVKK
jgi:hypothetical protein